VAVEEEGVAVVVAATLQWAWCPLNLWAISDPAVCSTCKLTSFL
jgi:hypothetical protein